MNSLKTSSEVSLHIPPGIWHQFSQALLQARTNREEVIGFFFCKRHRPSKRKVRYLPVSWVVPTPDCYEHQSTSDLVLKQQFHRYLLENYLQHGQLDVVHIHTHAGVGSASFSAIDDRYESEYARFLSSHFQKKPRLISGVFDESLQQSQFRIWDRKGQFFENVNFYPSWFELERVGELSSETDAMFARQAVFGEPFQRQLGQLAVALIGCGGIGAIFAELLGRLGVKHWVLVDRDRLETVNLNRMPGATWPMADQRWYKVQYVKQLIKRIYATGSSVKVLPTSIEDEAIERDIGAVDLIVVATDNHHSRQVAQELALRYQRPLMSLGTHIDVRADGLPRMYCRITVPPLGGGWCLMCGNIINLQRAALELAPREIDRLVARSGYLEGIDAPAVFWLNSLCASHAVGILQGIVGGFLDVDLGLDWIYEFPSSHWLKSDSRCWATPDCYFCGV
ncbi:MAG: ThiF family adenylyltransferase [Cyanobacteriota bacterium]|nr:ThiF family adenylyltransferase [Cyanobacteriota bacterium]